MRKEVSGLWEILFMTLSRKVFWGATNPRRPPGIATRQESYSAHWVIIAPDEEQLCKDWKYNQTHLST